MSRFQDKKGNQLCSACCLPVLRHFAGLDPNLTHAMRAYQKEKSDHLCSACYEEKMLGILCGIGAFEPTMPSKSVTSWIEKLFSRSGTDVELFLHFLSNYEVKDNEWLVELHLADDSTLEQAAMVTQALSNNGSVEKLSIVTIASPQQSCVCEVFALPIFQQLEPRLTVVAATRSDVEHLHRVDEMFAAAPNLSTFWSSFEISAPNDYSTAERLGDLLESSKSISTVFIQDAPADKETAIVYAEWFNRLLSDPEAFQRIDRISIVDGVDLDFTGESADLVVCLDMDDLQDPQTLQVWEAMLLRITGLQKLVFPGLVWSSIPTLIQNNQQSLSSLHLDVEFIRMVPDYLSVAPNLTELTVEGNDDAEFNGLAIDPLELEKLRRAFEVNTSLETIDLPYYKEFENLHGYGARNVANKAALKAVLALENGSLSVAAVPYILKRIFKFEKAQEIAAAHVQNLRRESLKMACEHSNGGETNI